MSISKNDTAVVIKNHKSDFPNPLILNKGERLAIGDKKTNFVGWIWCIAVDGNCGWVPEKFVKKTEDNCMMLVDYDSTELAVTVGENLTILSQESDWVLCLNSKNKRGWIPLENVRKL